MKVNLNSNPYALPHISILPKQPDPKHRRPNAKCPLFDGLIDGRASLPLPLHIINHYLLSLSENAENWKVRNENLRMAMASILNSPHDASDQHICPNSANVSYVNQSCIFLSIC